MVKVRLMPACEGDFILISYGEGKLSHILIDGGVIHNGCDYQNIIQQIHDNEEIIEALILTHIDNDHINGALDGIGRLNEIVLQKTIKKIYFNTCEGIKRNHHTLSAYKNNAEDSLKVIKHTNGYGVDEAITFLELLEQKNLKDKLIDYVIMGDVIPLESGAVLKIISPGKKELKNLCRKWENAEEHKGVGGYSTNTEFLGKDLVDLENEKLYSDSSVNNCSSIALLYEFQDVKIAFLADANSSVCLKGLRNFQNDIYKADATKVSHHGSRSNTSDKLLKRIKTNHYLLSTDGHGENVPNKVVIAHMLRMRKKDETINLYCNYPWWSLVYGNRYFTIRDKEEYLDKEKLKLFELTDEEIIVKDGLIFYGE